MVPEDGSVLIVSFSTVVGMATVPGVFTNPSRVSSTPTSRFVACMVMVFFSAIKTIQESTGRVVSFFSLNREAVFTACCSSFVLICIYILKDIITLVEKWKTEIYVVCMR